MTLDPAVVPGLLLLLAQLAVLAAVGYVVARVALRQTDEPMALAQGMVIGPALWGLAVSFILHVTPGLAGALVGWGITLGLGAVLAWRTPHPIRPRPRLTAGFALVAVAVLGVAMASRQTMAIVDPYQALGVGAAIRAGAFPPELSWNPGIPLRYHFGVDMMTGLLAPPQGPDLAFVSELLGAYFWTSLALIVVTSLRHRGGWLAVVAIAPLLITAGAWSWVGMRSVLAVFAPMPAELSSEAVAAVGETYWPPPPPNLGLPSGALPDIWLPTFTFAYALSLVVLERAAGACRDAWIPRLTLAALVGFLGLVQTGVVPVVVVLWVGIEAVHVVRLRHSRADLSRASVRSGTALALAAVMLIAGGGGLSGVLEGQSTGSVAVAARTLDEIGVSLGRLSRGASGSGLLAEIGPLVVAGVAAALGRRDRLVVALALGACMFTLAWALLDYPPAPWNMNRIAGHARYFALAALVLALAGGLARLEPRWRFAAATLLMLALVWPTIARPARILGMSLANGVEVANAARAPEAAASRPTENDGLRYAMPDVSPVVADYVRDRTPIHARVFTSLENAWELSVHTGRPNASGFLGHAYHTHHSGPELHDARNFLEPAAIRRMGIEYVHATEAWVAALPPRARAWLEDSRFFEPIVRDNRQALYRVRQAFLNLDVAPDPASFEALRRAVPPSATVYVVAPPREYDTLLVAAALSHARLVGELDPLFLHVIPPAKWQVEPLTDQTPDLVVLPTGAEPWMLPPTARSPIWWRNSVAVYAPTGAAPRILDGPSPTDSASGDPPPIRVEVTGVQISGEVIEFTAAFDEGGPQPWSGQDWIVIAGDRSPWAIPTEVFRHGREPRTALWVQGLLSPAGVVTLHTYRFDARVPELSVRNDGGEFTPLGSSEANLGPGGYTLALRLRHEFQPNQWRDAAVIPVLRARVSGDGTITYEPFAELLDGYAASSEVKGQRLPSQPGP